MKTHDIQYSKILVADDNSINQDLLKAIFSRENFILYFADDGLMALDKVDKHQPDIILLDVMMPNMDGLTALQKLKACKQHEDIPVILITALAEQESKIKGLSLGADDYITKPFNYTEVLLRTKNLLKIKKANDWLKRNNQLILETDRTTGLPNQELLKRLFTKIIEHQPENIIFIAARIEHLKQIKSALPNEFQSVIIKLIADRLSAIIPENSTLSIWEQDTFLILQENTVKEEIESLAQNIHHAFQEPFCFDKQEIFITLNLSASLYPKNGKSLEELSDAVMTALNFTYSNAQSVESKLQYYDQKMTIESTETLKMSSNLRRAIELEELALHYQPIVDLNNHQIVGAEALLRWQKDGKMISPLTFIPLVESLGLMPDFYQWTLKQVVQDANQWFEKISQDFYISINVSANLISSINIVDHLKTTKNKLNNKHINFAIEITESCFMDNMNDAKQLLHDLDNENFFGFIDDFGTGYSSFAYLKDLQATALKIDKSFIDDITKKHEAMAIVQSIIQLAHNLDMHVIAEGIEFEAQKDKLIELACTKGQGYLFSKPAPPSKFTDQSLD